MTYKELLHIANFRRLYIGQAISQLGDALYYLVFLFMTDKLTHGNIAVVALCGVAQTLPFLLLSLPAGALADRANRRTILLFADTASAIVLLLFAILLWFDATPPAWMLIAAGAVLSTINVVFAPAKSAAIPALVPADALPAANGLSMATQSLMPLVGIGFSGTLLAILYAISPPYFFLAAVLLNAASFVVSALFLVKLPPLLPDQDLEKTPNPIGDMRDGLAYVRQNRVLLILLGLNLLVNATIAPFMVVYVAVNREWFGGAYGTLALCEASFFLGMVGAGAFVGKLRITKPGLAFVWGLALVGITVVFMAYAPNPWLFAFWNVLAGITFPFSQIPMTTYVQTVVPDRFLGRVNSLMGMAAMGVQPLAIGLGGVLLSKIGVFWMLLGMGIAMTLASLLGLADSAFRGAVLPDAEGSTTKAREIRVV